MATLSPSIYQVLGQGVMQPQPGTAFRQGVAVHADMAQLEQERQRSTIGQLAIEEMQRKQQEQARIRDIYRQRYSQPPGAQAPQAVTGPGALTPPDAAQAPSAVGQVLAQTPGQPPVVQGAALGAQRGVQDAEMVRQLYQVSPEAGMAAEKAARDSHVGQLTMLEKQNEMVSQVARGILLSDTQQGYETGVQYLRQAGIPVDHLPQVYDRRLVEHYYEMTTDAVTRLKAQQLALQQSQEQRLVKAEDRQERTLAETLRHRQETSGRAERREQRLDERQAFEQGKGGLNPVYGVDEQGNPVVMQMTPTGQLRQAQVPGGVTPMGPEQKGFSEARGREAGKLAAERPALFRKQQSTLQTLERQWTTTEQDIDRALAQLESGVVPKTGLFSLAKATPGTPQHDLYQTLQTVRANIGFERLQQMRADSPTGGALGQVSDFENQLLQATAGSLAESQTYEQLKRNLERVKTNLAAARQERRAAFGQDYGDLLQSGSTGAPQTPPGVQPLPSGGRPTPRAGQGPGATTSNIGPYPGRPLNTLTPEQARERLEWMKQQQQGR